MMKSRVLIFLLTEVNVYLMCKISCYLLQVGKLKEIEEINEDVEILKKNGILIDNEADPDSSSGEQR